MRWHSCKESGAEGGVCTHCRCMKKACMGLTILSLFGLSLWLTWRLTTALETLAMTSSLKLGDKLSEDEKAELEERIRDNVLP